MTKLRKIFLLLALLFLSGCATYKFQKGDAPYENGYVVCYDGKAIPEYTLGKDNSVPDLSLAKERFLRRRATVEYYYKKLGLIEGRFKSIFLDPPLMMLDFLGGILRWPFIAFDDYKYNRDPEYRKTVDFMDEKKDELEKTQAENLKARLMIYVEEDLAAEKPLEQGSVAVQVSPEVAPIRKETPEVAPRDPVALDAGAVSGVIAEESSPKDNRSLIPQEEERLESPVAVITARPTKGASPLQVNFNGAKSYSSSGKIVSYSWDFGDGDVSSGKNPSNTYWSTTYGSRFFTAKLTVKDDKGGKASATVDIEVVGE